MAIIKNTDYVGQALKRLPDEFKDKPRIAAFLTALMDEIQEVEDALYDVYLFRALQLGIAFGDLLDKLGGLVGQAREGFSDAIYRILITARILVNRSNGKREEMIAIASLLMPNTVIKVRDYVPATFIIEPQGPASIVPFQVVFNFLKKAIAAGVRLIFIYSPVAVEDSLIFGSVYGGYAPIDTQSPGSVYIGGITGGVFASLFESNGGSSP